MVHTGPRVPRQNSAPGAHSGSLLASTLCLASFPSLSHVSSPLPVFSRITSYISHFTQTFILGSASRDATKDLWDPLSGIILQEKIPGLVGLGQPHFQLLEKMKTRAAAATTVPDAAQGAFKCTVVSDSHSHLTREG